MLCPNCHECLRRSEGVKCDQCGSVYHLQCTNDKIKCLNMESGDKGYYWICPSCKKSVSKTPLGFQNPQTILNAVTVISEKFELVNKIQIPKLNKDLIHLKYVTERIFKQNEEILSKINVLNGESKDGVKTSARSYLRRRKLNISPRTKRIEEKTTTIDPEKHVAYRTRTRSYSFLKTFLRLNKKVNGAKLLKRK